MEGILDQLQHPEARVGLVVFPVHHAHARKLRWIADELRLANHVNLQPRKLNEHMGVKRPCQIPIRRRRRRLVPGRVVRGQNHAQLIQIGLRVWRKPLANSLDIANGVQKSGFLIEERVLPVVQRLPARW